jgi:acyl-coenzyme A thioesterase PaaI-like protein
MTVLTIPEIEGLLRRHLPVIDHRGECVEEISKNRLRLRLPMRSDYVSSDLPPGSGQNVVSAPVMMGLADTAMYATIHAFYGAHAFACDRLYKHIVPPNCAT